MRMRTAELLRFNFQHPKLHLTFYFVAWKALLLFIALSSPGPGYDTSAGLALTDDSIDQGSLYQGPRIIEKLTRWDAIYFTQVAHRGYIYEQQWMAGWGFTKLLGLFLNWNAGLSSTALVALVGITIAHVSHLLSTLVLYELSVLSLQSFKQPKCSSMALLAACLHIISPAGMFLSAPYAESLFSLTTFLGFYLYGKSLLHHSRDLELREYLFLLLSGLSLGVSCTIRGNGLLSGLVFVHEAVMYIRTIFLKGFSRKLNLRRFIILLLAGMVMGSIAVFPQYLAYLEYCRPFPKRPWCSERVPSIYAWIQSHYWDVGFLHYWTFGNIPLFVLAVPMLYIMSTSSIWAWHQTPHSQAIDQSKIYGKPSRKINNISNNVYPNSMRQDDLLQRLAIPQIVLAVLALTSYHVQIITRLSSSYPVWYWWLAHMMTEDKCETVALGGKVKPGAFIVRWMVMYAIIQGGLFASFLPPA